MSRGWATALVLGLAASQHVLASTVTVVGVNPEDLGHYTKDKFACLDGSAEHDPSVINDDFCDCKDGSDEPGTSACSNGKFYCVNQHHQALTLPSSRVGDNICDCCDGSDERTGACQDVCLEIRRQTLATDIENLKASEAALKLKAEIVKVAAELRQEYGEKLKNLNKALETSTVEVEELLQHKAREEALEKEELEQLEAQREKENAAKEALKEAQGGTELTTGEKDASENVAGENQVVGEEAASATVENVEEKGKGGEVEEKKEENFPYPKEYQYQEEGEKDGKEGQDEAKTQEENFPYPKEYQFNADGEGEGEEGAGQEDEEAASQESAEGKSEESDGDTAEDEKIEYKRPEAEDARKKHTEAKEKLDKTKAEVEKLEKQLSTEYGEQDVFMSLLGQCYELRVKQYTYSVCPYNEAKQGGTGLGKFSKFEPNDDGEMVMHFTNGAKCWNGPMRSMLVTLHCGKEIVLSNVDEPSTCVYTAHLSTPAACDEEATRLLREHVESLMGGHMEL